MIAPPKFPFYRIHIDLSGPLPLTEKGNKYIFVAIDSLTKWLICAPIMDQKAETVSEILENEIICQHGAPQEIVSDNGKQFTSEIFANLSKIYGFRHIRTTPYHPEANGLCERQNRTIAQMLSAYVNTMGDDWDRYLKKVIFAYNVSIQKSTGQSPFFLNKLKDPVLPIDLTIGIIRTQIYDPENLKGNVETLKKLWTVVKNTIEDNQELQKSWGDEKRGACEKDLKIMDLVLVYRDYVPVKEKHKFRSFWKGPYRLIGLNRPNATIQSLEKGPPFTIHLNKIKKFTENFTLPWRKTDKEYRKMGDPNLEEEQEEEEG